ncbi:MAG: hypothetical protein KDA58_17275, partial [Planctomycetaceae bacterium]|nr:hypothetical protein [Planctomycetaceae bacterium]
HIARLQQDPDKAAVLLNSLAGLSAPAEYLHRVAAEHARLELSQQQYDAALTRLRKETNPSPEQRAVLVQILCTAAAIAGSRQQPQLQADLLEQAQQELALIPGHWHRWAQRQSQVAEMQWKYGAALAELVLAGQASYQQGDLSRAIQQFSEATRLAHELQRPDDAVEFALTRGSIQLQSGNAAAAATSFRQLVEAYPDHARTGEANLLLCYALATKLGQQPTASLQRE